MKIPLAHSLGHTASALWCPLQLAQLPVPLLVNNSSSNQEAFHTKTRTALLQALQATVPDLNLLPTAVRATVECLLACGLRPTLLCRYHSADFGSVHHTYSSTSISLWCSILCSSFWPTTGLRRSTSLRRPAATACPASIWLCCTSWSPISAAAATAGSSRWHLCSSPRAGLAHLRHGAEDPSLLPAPGALSHRSTGCRLWCA